MSKQPDALLLGCPVVYVDGLDVPTGDIQFGVYPPSRVPFRAKRDAAGRFVMEVPTWDGKKWVWKKEQR